MHRLGKYFLLKPESIRPPKVYLGGKLSQLELSNGVHAWAISASKYIQQVLRNPGGILQKYGLKLRRNTNSPLPGNYHPECDVTPDCDTKNVRFYAPLIGILRWSVELGRIDITCEISILSSYSAMPREGHIDHVMYMFSYLKTHHNSRLELDPTYPDFDMDQFKCQNWKQFYGDVKEILPYNTTKFLGKEFIIKAYVDADFAGDNLTRISQSGFIVMLNNSPLYRFSKKQSSMEISFLGRAKI